jgi:glycosyltransferase involved in cell wall biosynthesis
MNIAIDLRGLNYTSLTGVNTYTLHFLYCLKNIKQRDSTLSLTSIGLEKNTYTKLCLDYPFLINLFDDRLTMSQYLGIKYFNIPQSLISILIVSKMRFTKSVDWYGCREFDIILQPQPKPILIHRNTILMTVFHDIYSVIDSSTMSFRQRILENIFVYKLLADSSFKVLANSLSTAFDLENLMEIENCKIKLVYPAKPIWQTISSEDRYGFKTKITGLPKKYMLCVSGIESRKNWLNILKAFKYNQDKYDNFDYSLILAGRIIDKAYYETLVSYINQNVLNNIVFYLDLDQNDKNELYKNCEFVVYPSFYEGFGFPIIESFEYHKPVITSKISSMPELAKESGIYVNPLNYLEIAAAMYILISDKVFYKQLVDSIIKSKDRFDWTELEYALEKILTVDEI